MTIRVFGAAGGAGAGGVSGAAGAAAGLLGRQDDLALLDGVEVRHVLLEAVLDDDEVLLLEAGDAVPLPVRDDDVEVRDRHDFAPART